ncbi:hypothetical protein [Rhodococcus sp. IEGM 1379]|uniref:hypothetical protein n=1 Tax=Rhodococcus sp. IEGM 1379 TaxID=3047086 RepID=UPI0024B74047|nr:hypothetical protein [Rhodococcus sp. IEGM 1379]
MDERRFTKRILGTYQQAQVFIRRPDGTLYSEGSAMIVSNPVNGVIYEFGITSPFTVAGEYSIQIKLTRRTGEFDYTDPIFLDVFEAYG